MRGKRLRRFVRSGLALELCLLLLYIDALSAQFGPDLLRNLSLVTFNVDGVEGGCAAYHAGFVSRYVAAAFAALTTWFCNHLVLPRAMPPQPSRR